MIKRQLNPLRIGKGLLCLIAMFVMLLAPQVARAEDSSTTYTFTGMTGSSVSGYTYDVPSTAGGDSKIWRVKNFSATDESHGNRTTSAYVLSESSLGISNIFATSSSATIIDFQLESDFTLSGSFVSAEITYSTSSMSQCKAVVYKLDNYLNTLTNPNATLGTSPVTLSLKSDFEDQKNFDENKIALGFTFTTNRYDGYSGEFSIQSITINTTPLTYYNLWVGGRQVNTGNARNVMGDGGTPTVVFDESTSTLTLTNATINGNIESSLADDLTVHLVGANVIHNGEHAFLMSGNGGLKFTAASGAKLLTDATTDAMFAYSTSGSSAISLGINDLPNGYKLSYDAKLKRCIGESYDILIYAFTNGSSNLGPQCVTSANCDRLAGAYDETTSTWDNETITLSYNYSTTTLTLNNMNLETASPNGTVYFINCDGTKAKNITINLLGENKLRQFNGEEGARFIYNGHEDGQITITTDPQNPGSLTMPDMSATLEETDVLEMYYTNHVNYKNGLGYSKDENNVRYIQTLPSIGLTVAGVPVNASNASNVLDEVDEETELPTVSFDAEHNILTLNGANIYVENEDAIVSGLENLTVFLVGDNYITSYGNSSFAFNKSSAVDEATITFTTNAVSNGSLTIAKPKNYLFGTGVTPDYTKVSIKYGGDYNTIDSKLGLSVGGVDVTEFNKGNVFNTPEGTTPTVSFTPAVSSPATPAKLTLNGASFEGIISWENPADLTVEILGSNEVDTKHGVFFSGNENASLTLTTNSTNPGNLLLTSCYSYQVQSGWKNEANVIFNKESSDGDATDYDWYLDGESEQWHIRYNKKYDLWVDNVQLCDAQNEVSFDPQNYSGNRIIYEDGILKFNTVAKNTENSPFIKNGLSNLTIKLFGNNTVGCGQLFLTNNGGQTNNNITFTTDKTTSGTLVITTTGDEDDDWYTGHNAPTVTDLAFTDEMKNSVRTLTFSEPTPYNLTVANIPVTSANAANITGDYITTDDGNVSYDPVTYTLTLNNATIDLSQMEGPGIEYTGTENFTIKLIGTNSIKANYNSEPIIYDVYPAPTQIPTLTFESGSYPCSLSLQGVNSTVIKHFGGVQGVNGINSAEGNYLTISNSEVEVKYDPANSTNGLYTGESTAVTSVTISSIPDYGITVAGVSVSYANADDVLSDGTNTTDPTVTYDAESNTLSLNNATINGDIVYSSDSENPLWVNLYGTNTVNRITYTGQQEVSLYVRKAETTTVTHSLTVTGNNTDAVISGFENAQLEDEYYDIELGLYWKPTITNNIMTSLVITSNPFEGTGTSSSPYVISSAEQLIAFAKMYNGGQLSSQYCYVELSKDIDCSGLEDFEPIGLNQENPFYGNFNGGNHKIIGLSFLGVDNYYGAGLFGVIGDEYGSQSDFNYYVGNLELMNCSFTSNSHAGAIAGMLEYGTIENCKVTGTTTVNGGSYAGAIVGQYSGGTLTSNTYEYSVTTQVTDTPEKTGYASRGTGDDQDEDGNYDVTDNNGAVLYTKTLSTGTVSNATLEVWYPSQNGYNENGKFAPNQDAFISVTPSSGYLVSTVTVTYTENNVQKTITPELDEEKTGDGAYIYSFEMPDADATANATVTFDISSEAFAASIANATYTGSALTPTSVSLTPASGGDAIVLTNTDFTITGYQKGETSVNSPIDAGEYTVSIEGSGNYSGTRTVSYTIDPATITEVTLDKTSMPYSGAAQTVAISSVKAGDLVLGADDYTVTLNEVAVTGDIQATAVGEYTVAVTGQGNFTGTVSATFSIVNRTLADNEVTFHNNWATFYSADGDVMLPEGKNIGAYVATGIGDGVVNVSQISSIPEKVPVFLNNATETVATKAFDPTKDTNMLRHADNAVDADDFEGLIYGLHNGKMMRVTGTIPAGKNYLVAWEAQAPELSFVFEGDVTGVNTLNGERGTLNGDVYDLQGRKMQKLSKKGLYISNGRKVVVK